jgi:hypothetical protein
MWEVATDQMRSLWILPLLEDVLRSIEGVVGVVQFRAGALTCLFVIFVTYGLLLPMAMMLLVLVVPHEACSHMLACIFSPLVLGVRFRPPREMTVHVDRGR